MTRSLVLPLGTFALPAVVLAPAGAHAQSTIKRPGDRPAYVFEAEPHLLLAPFDAPGFGESPGYGAGFRGTLELSSDGFIPKLNDSVGLVAALPPRRARAGASVPHHALLRCPRRGCEVATAGGAKATAEPSDGKRYGT
jgi:hypothetical protein